VRCVFDTNVYVSALLASGSKPRMAIDRAMKSGKILISNEVLSELSGVLHRARFRRYLDENDIRLFLVALTVEAEWIEAIVPLSACRDPKDDKFLSLAVSGSATHIVTGARLIGASSVSRNTDSVAG
jgi:hypothetical protein